MTKTEKIMCAKKVWRNGRGRTARERRDMYIRAMRRKNIEEGWPKTWGQWAIENDFGVRVYFFGTLRNAKIWAHRTKNEWWGSTAYVRDVNTGIYVYETR